MHNVDCFPFALHLRYARRLTHAVVSRVFPLLFEVSNLLVHGPVRA